MKKDPDPQQDDDTLWDVGNQSTPRFLGPDKTDFAPGFPAHRLISFFILKFFEKPNLPVTSTSPLVFYRIVSYHK